jgi:hypothetical protein
MSHMGHGEISAMTRFERFAKSCDRAFARLLDSTTPEVIAAAYIAAIGLLLALIFSFDPEAFR